MAARLSALHAGHTIPSAIPFVVYAVAVESLPCVNTASKYKVCPESNAICSSRRSSWSQHVRTGWVRWGGLLAPQHFQTQPALSSGSVRIAVSVNLLLVPIGTLLSPILKFPGG
jgi:hypothetical protein